MSGLLELLELELNGVLYFKKAKAALNKNNLTFVKGANFDSDPANPTGNGSGKTQFFSTIANILYFSTPVAVRKRGSKKEMLGKGSKISLTFRSFNKKVYKVEQTLSKYTVYENGKDLKLRTVPIAEKFIRKIFPINELEFYTYCFLPSSGRVFQLQTDTDANRLEHLISIFRLNYHEDFKKYFAEQLKVVRKSETTLAVLEQNLVELKRKRSKENESLDEKALEKAKIAVEKLESSINKLVQKEFTLLTLLRTLETLLTIEKELDSLRAQYSHEEHPTDRISWLKQQRASVKSYEKYLGEVAAYNRSAKVIKKKLKAIKLPDETAKQLTSGKKRVLGKQESLRERIHDLEIKEQSYKSIVKEGLKLNRYIQKSKAAANLLEVDLKADYHTQLASCKTTLKLEHLLKHKHEGDKCPVCLSDLDLANIKKAVRAARKLMPELEAALTLQSYQIRLNELTAKLEELDYDEEDLNKAREQESELKAELEGIEKKLKLLTSYTDLTEQLEELKKPRPVGKPEVNLTSTKLDEEIDLCVEIVKHLEAKEKLLADNEQLHACRTVKEVKRSLVSYKKKLKTIGTELTAKKEQLAEKSAYINKCSGKKSAVELYANEITATEKSIRELKPSIEDQKVLETLIKAYGSKGLKILTANKICALLQDHLNHYRDLIFAEPFHFSASASESGLSIKVDRGHGMVSDVRNLSGSESNCFRLLMVLCLLVLLPANRKTNILVLDEPDTHMDAVSRRKFIDVFLPYLRDIVPNMYVITQSQEYLENSGVWLIKKNKGKSSLISI